MYKKNVSIKRNGNEFVISSFSEENIAEHDLINELDRLYEVKLHLEKELDKVNKTIKLIEDALNSGSGKYEEIEDGRLSL